MKFDIVWIFRRILLLLYFFSASCVSAAAAAASYLDDAILSVYFQLLPTLGLNRHITKEFRTLPTRYQWLGLRHPNIEVLSAKSTFQLDCDCGLSGNPFAKDYERDTVSWGPTLVVISFVDATLDGRCMMYACCFGLTAILSTSSEAWCSFNECTGG